MTEIVNQIVKKKEIAQRIIEELKKEGLEPKSIAYIGSTIYSLSRAEAKK